MSLTSCAESDPATAALDVRLAAIVQGKEQPRDSPDRLQLAQRAYQKGLHVTAARLWADALAAQPRLGDDRQAQHRYNAACAAALAGCGMGKEAPSADARARLLVQAHEWLTVELATWANILESGPPQARPSVSQILKHWLQDADLAGTDDEIALAKLPETERKDWQSLWANVEALRKRAEALTPR